MTDRLADAELAARAAEVAGEGCGAAAAYGTVTVDVPRERWVDVATALRDALALDQLDLVTAVDEEAAGFDVVLRAWSTARRHGLVVRTRVPRDDPRVDSLVGVWAGAAWHERHAAEMLGVQVDGHPGLTRLLLRDDVTGPPPLRKEVLLDARQATPWPGRKEPGESDADAQPGHRGRRRSLPPGVAP